MFDFPNHMLKVLGHNIRVARIINHETPLAHVEFVRSLISKYITSELKYAHSDSN